MDGIDPLAGKIGERRKVLFRREPARLEASHLARRCRCPQRRLAANKTHRGIMTQAFCVVHVLIPGKPPKHGLPQHSDESMPAVLASACVGEYIAGHRSEAERIVEFPVREQAGVGRDHRSSKLEHRPAVRV